VILAALNAIAAIPQLLGLLESACAQITLWYVQRANNETLGKIADAASASAAAQTTDDRLAAANLWRIALSRNRVTPS
jgi:hypothetical protein